MKVWESRPRKMWAVTRGARIRRGMLEREFRKVAAVPWKSACTLAGMWRSFWTFVTAEIALPSAAPGERLKETVMAGNCPGWLMERDWVLVSKCENALIGTGLLVAELEVPANVAPLLEVAEEVLAVSAFTGVERVLADGGKRGEGGSGLEPAAGGPWPVGSAG